MKTSFDELLAEHGFGEFSAFASYDKGMDTIRIETRDCSTYEVRVNETLTLVMDLYPKEDETKCVGFVLKGIAHAAPEAILDFMKLLQSILIYKPA